MSDATNAPSLGSQFRSLRDVVCSELRDRIVEGELAPGTRLVERDLADNLDVSRIVIREAIQQLASEGLIAIVPRRGAQVAALDPEYVTHLFEVRLSLESLAARLAATHRTDDDLTRLSQLLDEAHAATANADAKVASHANVDFHLAVVDASANPLLSSIVRSLSGQVLRVFRIGQDFDSHGLHREHEALYKAIRARKPDVAEKIAHDHIARTQDKTVERVRAMFDGE